MHRDIDWIEIKARDGVTPITCLQSGQQQLQPGLLYLKVPLKKIPSKYWDTA